MAPACDCHAACMSQPSVGLQSWYCTTATPGGVIHGAGGPTFLHTLGPAHKAGDLPSNAALAGRQTYGSETPHLMKIQNFSLHCFPGLSAAWAVLAQNFDSTKLT